MHFIVPGELCDLNTYINKERSNKFMAAKIKREETQRVIDECYINRLQRIENPVIIDCHWITKDIRKDPDNVAFAKKFILDGLVKAGILPNDGRKQIIEFTDSYGVDKDNPRVIVTITEYGTENPYC